MSGKWIALMLGLASCTAVPPAAPDRSEKSPFDDARAAVLLQLKDPDSARFGEMSRGLGQAICGQVNARNGFGGYTGMQPFAYDPERANPADRLYFYDAAADMLERGRMAEIFEERGCRVGPDHDQVKQARRLYFNPPG